MRSEILLPQMIREKTSRPKSSVPNQCFSFLPARRKKGSCSKGSWGEIQGARMATNTMKTAMTPPAIAVLFLEKVNHVRWRWEISLGMSAPSALIQKLVDSGIPRFAGPTRQAQWPTLLSTCKSLETLKQVQGDKLIFWQKDYRYWIRGSIRP